MKRSPEPGPLLRDVFGEDAGLRKATLRQGMAAMRRKRTRRRAVPVGTAIMAVVLIGGFFAGHLWRERQLRAVETPTLPSSPGLVAGTDIRVLDDEQLLAIFADRPVALVGAPGSRNLLLLDEGSSESPSQENEDPDFESSEQPVSHPGGS